MVQKTIGDGLSFLLLWYGTSFTVLLFLILMYFE